MFVIFTSLFLFSPLALTIQLAQTSTQFMAYICYFKQQTHTKWEREQETKEKKKTDQIMRICVSMLCKHICDRLFVLYSRSPHELSARTFFFAGFVVIRFLLLFHSLLFVDTAHWFSFQLFTFHTIYLKHVQIYSIGFVFMEHSIRVS